MDEIPLIYQRCAIYTRQSRASAGDFSSCQAQFESCHHYVVAQYSKGRLWNGERYDDDGQASETLDRQGLKRLLADLDSGTIRRVVVHRFDRLSRRVRDLTELMQQFRSKDVDLTVVTAPELGSSAADTMVLNILAAFAEFEHEMICDRLAESRAAHKARGRRVAGNVPYGYVADPENRQLVVVPTEAERVRTMFSLAAKGTTPSEIARMANERGWRTKRRRNTKGGPWTPRQVLATLANPTYLGLIRWQGESKPGIHEAIVDQQTFDEAAAQIASRCTRQPGRSERNWEHLRGRLVCGSCGRLMSPSTTSHGNIRYCYFRCRSNAGGRPPCDSVSLPGGQAYRMVIHMLDGIGSQADANVEEREFAIAWSELNDNEKRQILPDIVTKAIWDADQGTMALTVADDALDHIAEKLIAAGR